MSGPLSFDHIAAQYDATRSYPPEVSRQIARGLMRLGAFGAGDEILEVGIGTGRIALPLLAEGVNVTGVDISAAMVERMREKLTSLQPVDPALPCGKLTVHLADVTTLPLASGTFAASVGVHIFHLVPRWRQVLAEALRVLQPGGVFLMGQDMRKCEALDSIFDRWEEIVSDLGFACGPVGAFGSLEVVHELHRLGLLVEETVICSWTAGVPPRAVLASVINREWSRTWLVPDDIFAESARRLTEWATVTFGAGLDSPQIGIYSFKAVTARDNE